MKQAEKIEEIKLKLAKNEREWQSYMDILASCKNPAKDGDIIEYLSKLNYERNGLLNQLKQGA